MEQSSTKILCYFSIVRKTAQSKQSPNRLKIGQSGRPVRTASFQLNSINMLPGSAMVTFQATNIKSQQKHWHDF
jgi:hypothetical protein